MLRKLSLAGLMLVGPGGLAIAHHSYAMFDRTRELTVTGTVKELQLTNPHSWLQLLVQDASGNAVEYGFESGSPVVLRNAGWTKNSVHAGDKVTVTYQPLRDGSTGGQLISVLLPNGSKLTTAPPRFGSPSPASP